MAWQQEQISSSVSMTADSGMTVTRFPIDNGSPTTVPLIGNRQCVIGPGGLLQLTVN
jgi:hypothetical protein